MKNFNIMWVHEKSGSRKTNIAWRESGKGLAKKGGGVFEWGRGGGGGVGNIPMHTMKIFADKFDIDNVRFNSFINI